MPLPPPPNETDAARIVDYIRTMTQELAIMADRAGQTALAEHLRMAPTKIERQTVRH